MAAGAAHASDMHRRSNSHRWKYLLAPVIIVWIVIVNSANDSPPGNKIQQHAKAVGGSLLVDRRSLIDARVQSWLDGLPNHYQKVSGLTQHNHDRFFVFEPMASCKQISEVGRAQPDGTDFDDDSKMLCGVDSLQTNDCIIYSIGSNNEWAFELDLLRRTNCAIHTFDCTGPKERFHVPPNDRLHFHHTCLGHESQKLDQNKKCRDTFDICGDTQTLLEIQNSLGHSRVDVIKMDMEGFELKLFESWWRSRARNTLPVQMLVEIHYRTYELFFDQVACDNLERKQDVSLVEQDFCTASGLVRIQKDLLEMGYIVVSKQNNPLCLHCTEVVLIRAGRHS